MVSLTPFANQSLPGGFMVLLMYVIIFNEGYFSINYLILD